MPDLTRNLSMQQESELRARGVAVDGGREVDAETIAVLGVARGVRVEGKGADYRRAVEDLLSQLRASDPR